MFRAILISVVTLAIAASASAQGVPAGFDLSNFGVRIEPDRRVIVVLAALEAARTTDANGDPVRLINTPLSAEGSKFRDLLDSDLAAMDNRLRERISSFVLRHKRARPNASDAEIVAPFISMAYTLAPVPDLGDPVITSDLPASLLDVLDFAPLVRDFYRSTNISANLNDYVKRYTAVSDERLRGSAREMVLDLVGFLRTRPQIYYTERVVTETPRSGSSRTTLRQTETIERQRRFIIVPEMLAPAGTVNFVNVKDDYYVILPPDTDLSYSEVRRGYLQYIIDPMVYALSRDVATIQPALRTLLDERRKTAPNTSPDVYLAISRSLVAAIDAKQLETERIQIATAQARQKIDRMTNDADRKAVSAELDSLRNAFTDETALRLTEDFQRGSVLVFYFAEKLTGIEDAGFDISASLRDLIISFDAAKEGDRLAQYSAAAERARKAREEGRLNAVVAMIENPVTTRLIEIQETINAKKYREAELELKEMLKTDPDEPRIFYNIGRVSGLAAQGIEDEEEQKVKLLEAKVAYENVIRLGSAQRVDPALLSLSYVALGKIYEFYDEKAYALAIYDAALKLGPVSGGGYDEAFSAKQRLLKELQD
jgi:hypothetical protein